MTASLADTLAVVLPALAPELAPAQAAESLLAPARGLAPVSRGGLEVRLLADGSRVDLQQCFVAGDGEPDALLAHLPAAELEDFAKGWADPASGWGEEIPEVWLEFDQPDGTSGPAVPSVFVGLRQTLSEGERKLAALEDALDLLAGPLWTSWRENVRRCFAACQDTFVSHVGVMLSRGAPGLRVNVKRLRPDTLVPHLRRMGWAGDEGELRSVADPLFDHAERITVCLDVGDRVGSDVGLECVADTPAARARLLDHLVERGWCTAAKRSALLRWPGTDTPVSVARSWPSDLIVESLLRPEATLGAIQRELSHIKVTLRPGRPPEAKGYLWFGHAWHDSAVPAEPTAQSSDTTHLERVRDYYEATTAAYLEHLGTTFQGWLFEAGGDAAESNRRLAARAGVESGQTVLDAGCGVGGPAVDIAAEYDIHVEGITISETQATVAAGLIRDAGRSEQVLVRAGDYHRLPWPDDHFDLALFLESAGQSEAQHALFGEVHRVLRPGGTLYIKDAFKPADDQLGVAERRAVEAFDEMFVYRTPTLAQTTNALAAAGFGVERALDLTGSVSGDRWREAAVRSRGGALEATELGERHATQLERWPVFCGEILARKPEPAP